MLKIKNLLSLMNRTCFCWYIKLIIQVLLYLISVCFGIQGSLQAGNLQKPSHFLSWVNCVIVSNIFTLSIWSIPLILVFNLKGFLGEVNQGNKPIDMKWTKEESIEMQTCKFQTKRDNRLNEIIHFNKKFSQQKWEVKLICPENEQVRTKVRRHLSYLNQ